MATAIIASSVTVVLYNVQVRRLHRFDVLRNLQEWLLWTGLVFFGLLLVEGVFQFYFLFVLVTIIVGCSVFVWIRFFRFPPHDHRLQRAVAPPAFLRPDA